MCALRAQPLAGCARMALTVLEWSNITLFGDFTPVLATLEIVLVHRLHRVGVDRIQRTFEPIRKEVEAWQRSELTDVTAKVVICEALVEGKLKAPKHLARTVRRRSGASRMHSPPHSKNSILSHSSRRQPSWANSWKPWFSRCAC